jgi:type III secretion system YscQ/HrcQ family protein
MVALPVFSEEGGEIRSACAADFVNIEPDQAAASRLVCDPRFAEWLGKIFDASFHPAKEIPLRNASLVVGLACPDGLLEIVFPAHLMPALALAISADSKKRPVLAPLIASKSLAFVLERFGEAAKSAGDDRWQSIEVVTLKLFNAKDSVDAIAPLIKWDVSVAKRLHASFSLQSAGPGCIDSLHSLISGLPVRRAKLAKRWRVATMIRLSTKHWTLEILQSLEPGDVLLIKDNGLTNVIEGRLFCGALAGMHWIGTVRINHQKVTLMSDMDEHDGRDDEDEAESLAPPFSSKVAELEVPVHFEIDSTALTLDQLSSLRRGYVIELGIPVKEAEIRLVSCGQIIGRGRLVVVADCIGVQLESLASTKP